MIATPANRGFSESLGTIEKEIQTTLNTKMPPGYIAIELSTQGRVGAPKKFHIRNFTTQDLLSLAMTEEAELPIKVVQLLDGLIYEEQVSTADFHEHEVIETLLILYAAFYSTVIPEYSFPWNEEDINWLKENSATDEDFLARKKALEKGDWNPKTSLNLESLQRYELSDSFSSIATFKKKDGTFNVGFRLPRFGDALVIKKWLDTTFGEQEKTFSSLQQRLELRTKLQKEYRQGLLKDIDLIPSIDQKAEEQYKDFYRGKSTALISAIRALHLYRYEGQDVSKLSIKERIDIIENDKRFDNTLTKRIDKYFNSLQFGINPEVAVFNPITNESCLRRLSFRFVDILQAIQLSDPDGYDIVAGEDDVP